MSKFTVEYKIVNRAETGVETRTSKSVLEGVMLQHLNGLIQADERGEVALEFLTIRKVVEKPAKIVPQPKQLLKEAK